MRISTALIALFSVIGCSGPENPGGSMVATSDSVGMQLHSYSSRVLDGLRLSQGDGGDGQYNILACEAGRKMTHFWQVDNVQHSDLGPSIHRLKRYLEKQAAWTVVDFANPPEVINALLLAENSGDGYSIYVKGVQDLNRIAVQVSSPCLKIAETDL